MNITNSQIKPRCSVPRLFIAAPIFVILLAVISGNAWASMDSFLDPCSGTLHAAEYISPKAAHFSDPHQTSKITDDGYRGSIQDCSLYKCGTSSAACIPPHASQISSVDCELALDSNKTFGYYPVFFPPPNPPPQ